MDEARSALGGRLEARAGRDAPPRCGDGAAFTDARGVRREGVVVCATAETLDVWLGDGRFQRLARARVTPMALSPEHPLAEVAADAQVFARIAERDRVRFVARDGAMREGVLVEKCRYGALVDEDGTRVLAVSFRRLWPLDT